MSKKTLDLTIELLKKLFHFDKKNFIPIKFSNLNIGWVHKENNQLKKIFCTSKDYIDVNEILVILKNKKLVEQIIEKNFKEVEFCPVFKKNQFTQN